VHVEARARAPRPPAGGAFPDLAGIDSDRVIADLGGDVALYRRMLGMFCDSERDFPERFRRARSRGAPEDALRIVHTLRGVSGSLGMGELFAVASNLENAMRAATGHAPPEELVREVGTVLDEVIAELDQSLAVR
jgi:HPt (histidine-containing phosphotransfer) domain-containing protein